MNPLQAMLEDYKINEDYSMPSREYKDLLLKNNLVNNKNINTSMFGQQRTDGILVDPETEYSLNNFGYRDIDWTNKAEILAVGCSVTWGYGVPANGRWTNILGKKINKEIQNLSFPGGSINDLIAKIFEYCKIFGNPETILCLFPDPFRLKLPIKKNIIKNYMPKSILNNQSNANDIPQPDLYFSTTSMHRGDVPKAKYFKKPFLYEETLPLELPIFFSMQSIHLLEQYCNSNSINLIWSTWHSDTFNVLLHDQENIFSNVLLNENLLIGNHINQNGELNINEFPENCHQEYKDYFKNHFIIGGDTEDGILKAHPGVHRHIHIAEAFYEEINK